MPQITIPTALHAPEDDDTIIQELSAVRALVQSTCVWMCIDHRDNLYQVLLTVPHSDDDVSDEYRLCVQQLVEGAIIRSRVDSLFRNTITS